VFSTILKQFCLAFLVCCVSVTSVWSQEKKLDQKIDLIDGSSFDSLSVNLDTNEKVNEHFSFSSKGILRITGKKRSALQTKEKYRNFHLVIDYSWGEHTWGARADSARSLGVHLHAGTFEKKKTIQSMEVVLQEGRTGDIVQHGRDRSDSRLIPNKKKDSSWKDIKGYWSFDSVEHPVGERNRIEIIRAATETEIVLNGVSINKADGLKSSMEYISLIPEGAELFISRLELWPAGEFREKWNPSKRSTDTGYSATDESILPRQEPWSPDKSRRAWDIDGDFELQLVACEPLVCDPADVAWDEFGRMYVAEMRDYPFAPEDGPRLSRIRLLKDTDQDGQMDEAITWADNLPDVQGMLPVSGGLLITCSKGVLFLKDTNNDGFADKREPIFLTNTPRHNQLQISSPRWRLNNKIHFNNGIDGKEITSVKNPQMVLPFKGNNLTYDPLTEKLTKEPGVGQFGACIDQFDRLFFCSNRNPVMFAVQPKAVLNRNPFANITKIHEDIQPPASKVYPYELSHTTSIAHAGTHTSACGLAVYKGDWIPELSGEVFVCDPTSQLITRNKLVNNGSSFIAERVGDHRDFLVSADEWSRPVNIKNGPDGALYICDMYRRFIDHAVYFPKEFSESNYMRAGFDHGRIWRLAPKGSQPRKMEALPKESKLLVKELTSDISWRRVNAQRLLMEKPDAKIVPELQELLKQSKSPIAKIHALWTLQGLNERGVEALQREQVLALLESDDPGLLENVIKLIASHKEKAFQGDFKKLLHHPHSRVRMFATSLLGETFDAQDLATLLIQDAADTWILQAVLSIHPDLPSKVLTAMIKAGIHDKPSTEVKDLRKGVVSLTKTVAATGKEQQLEMLLGSIPAENTWLRNNLILGLSEGLPRTRFKSLSNLVAKPPASLKGKTDVIQSALEEARKVAVSSNHKTDDRLDAIALIRGELFPLLDQLIQIDQPPEVQLAVCRAMSRYNREKVADFFFERWDSLGPIPRREAISLIAANNTTALRLMKKMKAGEIPKSLMPPMSRWLFGRSSNQEIKSLSIELFGQSNSDRGKIISEYQAALKEGEVARGEKVFIKAGCVNCHKPLKSGNQIGPNIQDVKSKPPVALLTDILDPNRVVEERWTVYNVVTVEGQIISGLIKSETATSIEMVQQNGQRQTIARDQIDEIATAGLSIMPIGLEKQITKEQMSDLIQFLKSPQKLTMVKE
jgi:putative membrane-bound dehydrogenase-like protein